jgi:hypothetical protein
VPYMQHCLNKNLKHVALAKQASSRWQEIWDTGDPFVGNAKSDAWEGRM